MKWFTTVCVLFAVAAWAGAQDLMPNLQTWTDLEGPPSFLSGNWENKALPTDQSGWTIITIMDETIVQNNDTGRQLILTRFGSVTAAGHPTIYAGYTADMTEMVAFVRKDAHTLDVMVWMITDPTLQTLDPANKEAEYLLTRKD
jgi:hypothetical protein